MPFFIQETLAIGLTVFLVCFVALFIVFLALYLTSSAPQPLSQKSLTAKEINPLFEPGSKALVLYAYHESDDTRKQNLQCFLNRGVMMNSSIIDYIFIIQGETTVIFPNANNITILKRENQGWDFGAWSFGLHHALSSSHKYNLFAFINSSCRGPFTRKYNVNSNNWLSLFASKLNENVGIVGASINCEVTPHVQTYAFVLTQNALTIAMKHKIFDPVTEDTVAELITNREIGLSTALMSNHLKIDCMMKIYQGMDWKPFQECNLCLNSDGVMKSRNPTEVPLEKTGDWIDAEEVIFAKCKQGHILKDHIEKIPL